MHRTNRHPLIEIIGLLRKSESVMCEVMQMLLSVFLILQLSRHI